MKRLMQKAIYDSCYLCYRVLMLSFHPKIKALWYRNSYCFHYWVFGKSDIDITVVLEKATRELVDQISKTHYRIRKFLPVIGELVIHSEFHHKSLSKCINPLELLRDPLLCQQYPFNKSVAFEEKIVFLHKFISVNWDKKDLDLTRKDKIVYYMKWVDLPINSLITFGELYQELSTLLCAEDSFARSYKEQLQGGLSHEIPSPKIYALFYNQLCFIKYPYPLTQSEKNLLKATVYWELWGCFSYQALISQQDMKNHFERLVENLDDLVALDFKNEVIAILDDLGFSS